MIDESAIAFANSAVFTRFQRAAARTCSAAAKRGRQLWLAGIAFVFSLVL